MEDRVQDRFRCDRDTGCVPEEESDDTQVRSGHVPQAAAGV